MEESEQASHYTQPELNHRVFSFLKVGLIELISITAVLFLFFGTLNYFNILNVSSAVPIFSFLPHLSISRTLTQTTLLQEIENYDGLIYNWQVSVIGRVVGIKGRSIAINHGNNTLTFTPFPKTEFREYPNKSNTSQNKYRTFSLNDIKIGDPINVFFYKKISYKFPVSLVIFKLDEKTYQQISQEFLKFQLK